MARRLNLPERAWWRSWTRYCAETDSWSTQYAAEDPPLPKFTWRPIDVARRLAKLHRQSDCIRCLDPVSPGTDGLALPCCCASVHLRCLSALGATLANPSGYSCPVCYSWVTRITSLTHVMSEDDTSDAAHTRRWEIYHALSPKTSALKVDHASRRAAILPSLSRIHPENRPCRF